VVPQAGAAGETAPSADGFKFTLPDGSQGAIQLSSSVIRVTGAVSLEGHRKENKRKYTNAGSVVAEIKYYEGGAFKLRRADGSGVWKVNRYTPESGGARFKVKKVQSGDNSEHLVVRPENGGWRVDIDELEVGQVVRTDTGFEVRSKAGEVVLTAEGRLASGGLGLWLSPDVEAVHRPILLAELLAAGL
jgi:hypothetical protein